MISSGEEAGYLLKKWAAEPPALLHLILTDVGVRLSVVGVITATSDLSFDFEWERGNLSIQILSNSTFAYEEPRDPPEYYLDKYKYVAWLDIKTPPSRRCFVMEITPIGVI